MLILSIGGVLAKIFSAIYRIALTRILGGEGIGLYQLIFPLYSLCVVLTTAGLPMAISKVVSKHRQSKSVILKKCMLTTCLFGLLVAVVLSISCKGLASLQGAKELWICYLILAPSIILVCAASVLRGYFQGMNYFTPTTVSNILEQFVKLALGLGLSLVLINKSLIAAIVGAVSAIVVSEIVSFLVLLLCLKRQNKHQDEEQADVDTKGILKDILPITLTNIILPISGFIDSLLVVNLLAINFTKKMSIFLYGLESGAVASLIGLPTIFSLAIASVLLPSLTSTNHIYNKTYKLALGLKVVLMITIPCVVCFTFFPDKIIKILYADKLSGYGVEGLNVAYRLLAISGFGVVFLAINQLYSSCLQAVEKRITTVVNLSVAVAVKFFIEIVFMPSKLINIYALAIGSTACYVTAMLLNHLQICASFPLKFDYVFMCKLLLANSILFLALIVVFSISESAIFSLLGIVLSGCVYLFTLYKLKILSKKDLALMKYVGLK